MEPVQEHVLSSVLISQSSTLLWWNGIVLGLESMLPNGGPDWVLELPCAKGRAVHGTLNLRQDGEHAHTAGGPNTNKCHKHGHI